MIPIQTWIFQTLAMYAFHVLIIFFGMFIYLVFMDMYWKCENSSGNLTSPRLCFFAGNSSTVCWHVNQSDTQIMECDFTGKQSPLSEQVPQELASSSEKRSFTSYVNESVKPSLSGPEAGDSRASDAVAADNVVVVDDDDDTNDDGTLNREDQDGCQIRYHICKHIDPICKDEDSFVQGHKEPTEEERKQMMFLHHFESGDLFFSQKPGCHRKLGSFSHYTNLQIDVDHCRVFAIGPYKGNLQQIRQLCLNGNRRRNINAGKIRGLHLDKQSGRLFFFKLYGRGMDLFSMSLKTLTLSGVYDSQSSLPSLITGNDETRLLAWCSRSTVTLSTIAIHYGFLNARNRIKKVKIVRVGNHDVKSFQMDRNAIYFADDTGVLRKVTLKGKRQTFSLGLCDDYDGVSTFFYNNQVYLVCGQKMNNVGSFQFFDKVTGDSVGERTLPCFCHPIFI